MYQQYPIEGDWVPVRLEHAGELAPELVLEKTEVVFKDGHYTVLFAGEVTYHGQYTLTPTEGQGIIHATLVIEGRGEQHAGKIILAICQIVGGRLRICFGMDGVFPEAFATKPGTSLYMGTYRRKG